MLSKRLLNLEWYRALAHGWSKKAYKSGIGAALCLSMILLRRPVEVCQIINSLSEVNFLETIILPSESYQHYTSS